MMPLRGNPNDQTRMTKEIPMSKPQLWDLDIGI